MIGDKQMQTFLPYADFHKSAQSLDYRRLGKQRVETLQILNSLLGINKAGWKNHPATKMWLGYESALSSYGVAICQEWISRGYRDTCLEKISSLVAPDQFNLPEWIGDERVHSSHRANLLRKLPEHYSQFGWTEDPAIPYFWPTNNEDRITT